MTNMKKIGLSALAGSLAMFSVNADIALSGSAEMTYTNNHSEASGSSVTGNPFGMSHDINITGTGELENGYAYSVNSNFAGQDMGHDSAILKLDMGDLGTLGFDQGSGAFGIGTLENKVPTAYEEADHGVGTLAHGIDAEGDTSVIGYSNTFSGVGVSVEINPVAGGTAVKEAGGVSGAGALASNYNYALSYEAYEGLTLNYGGSQTDVKAATGLDRSESTIAANYVMGAVSVGVQMSNVESGNSATAQEIQAYGLAFNVNDQLSVSFNRNDNEQAGVTEESTGVNAAYSMGSASVRLSINEADNVGGVSATKAENTELSISLAF